MVLTREMEQKMERILNAITDAQNEITTSKTKMTNAITAVKDDIADWKEKTAAAITAIKEEMNAAIAASREETNAAIAAVDDDVTARKDDITKSREEMRAAITAMKNDITTVKEEISARVDDKILSVEENFQKQMTQLRKEFAETTFALAQSVFSSNVSKPLIKLSTFDETKNVWSVYKTQLEMVANVNGWNDATSAIPLAASLYKEAAEILQTLSAEKRNSLQDLLKALELRSAVKNQITEKRRVVARTCSQH